MANAPSSTTSNSPRSPRGRLTLQLKTMVGLLVVLVSAVALCGLVFVTLTQSILRESKIGQVNQFAYGMASSLSVPAHDRKAISEHLAQLQQSPDIVFARFTDTDLRESVGYATDDSLWQQYIDALTTTRATPTSLGMARIVTLGRKQVTVTTVPIFSPVNPKDPGSRSTLHGYLHVAVSNEAMAAQIRYLQGSVILTCMAIVLLAAPIAAMIAKHITVPIMKLAHAAHALADGDLAHRVALKRTDELGELTDAFNTMADTVERQQADIRKANANLEQKVLQRTAELEKVNNRLQAEISEKEDFLRAVSHDLNAPLRNIAGMASMLIMKYKDTLEKDALQRLERIQKNVQVETDLINELLELSRLKTRREKIERVDLHELVTQVADQFQNDFETRKITFRVRTRLPHMQGERARLRQAFQNLIDNAIKYMREDGPREINVNIQWARDEAILQFADTGMGIAADDLPQLFHVFRRAKNASVMKIPGKGVGLASVKSIFENYHGRLWVESTQGVGTTFFIAIPLQHFEAAQSHEVAA